MTSDDAAPGPRRTSRLPGRLAWAGIALHAALGVFPYSVTGLLAPVWGVVVLGVWWVALLVAALRLRRRRPWWTAAVPVVAAASWFGALTLGDLLLGWTA